MGRKSARRLDRREFCVAAALSQLAMTNWAPRLATFEQAAFQALGRPILRAPTIDACAKSYDFTGVLKLARFQAQPELEAHSIDAQGTTPSDEEAARGSARRRSESQGTRSRPGG